MRQRPKRKPVPAPGRSDSAARLDAGRLEVAPTAAARTEPIVGQYQMSVGEQVRNIPALNRGTWFANGTGAFFAMFGIVDIAQGQPLSAAIAFVFAASLVSGYYGVPFGWFTLSRHSQQALAPVVLLATGDGLRFETNATQLEVPWATISRIREKSNCFYVTARYPRAFMVPKRAFGPAQLEAFRRLASSKTGLPLG
jgi:hypothetical protein